MKSAITTTLGAAYTIEGTLGQGGQGTVVRLRSQQGLAAKILHLGSEREREGLRNRIAFVRSLPLSDLPIAMPIDGLASPQVGYTMRLLRDMVPATALIRPPQDSNMTLAQWYGHTGGIVRRLRLMAKGCDILGEIHARGLCYGDVSPRNLYISERGADAQVWFIDADNLKYEDRAGEIRIYTPGYGAPEVVSGCHGASTLADSHSMAVLSFQSLTLAHPLIGDAVSEGDPELEEKALRGELPWIEDESDSSNRFSQGVPRDQALSPNLKKIFAQFFTEGLKNPSARPGVATLGQALHAAADFTVMCDGCHHSFYPRQRQCPWCDAPRPTFLLMKTMRWEPSTAKAIDLTDSDHEWPRSALPYLAIPFNKGVTLTSRIVMGAAGIRGNVPQIKLASPDGKKVSIELVDDRPIFVGSAGSSKLRQLGEKADKFSAEDWLHAGPADKPHRVFKFLKT